ncbi:DUF3240 family protein [Paremcibacter congregatus]|uniref:DUF3240 domain-containing protein n=1 Tax=Paremcibacter congregatus TaxID=2043170 RepID=A0A2G4YW01_9PROT|nr:DUF3240 family protein [Paremcibacter congregatus]PHZ86508.1 hypothetical protein CRD36_01080 [Paremcibacter congregatus]QDE26311.1 DUF3240 domain-containing protein [Paremcibacter congregatus]
MTLCLLTITTPSAVEDVIVDWFLEQEDIGDFNSMPAFGHGSHEGKMSVAERVTGRSRKTMFQLHLSLPTVERILAKLKKDFAGTEIHYMMSPLMRAGDLTAYEA